jgi:hypothetical protein
MYCLILKDPKDEVLKTTQVNLQVWKADPLVPGTNRFGQVLANSFVSLERQTKKFISIDG